MNNVILAIVAIALVALLSGAGVFLGGDIYKNSRIDAEVVRYINESEQIASAITLYESAGNEVTTTFKLGDLVTEKYLSVLPVGWDLHMNTVGLRMDEADRKSASICFEMNKSKEFIFTSDTPGTIPYIDDERYAIPYCTIDLDLAVPCCFDTP